MPAQMLVIDGPMKGQLLAINRLPVVYLPDGETQPRSYWTHTWTLLGRMIRLLSICVDPDEIEPAVLWEALISEDAKAAAGY